MKKRRKCYLYTRVSTYMQVDGYSLDAQRQKLRKYAEYEDMLIVGEYSDEGFPGKNIQGQHEFQRRLSDMENGHIEIAEDEVEVIRTIYDHRSSKSSYSYISHYLGMCGTFTR